jgi:NADH dehydrogenase [ubiquinone] 1 alpha subcomplex assembly factor 7
VLSPSATPAARSLMSNERAASEFGIARDSSGKASIVAVEKPSAAAAAATKAAAAKIKDGEGIEVSPLSLATCEDIGRRVAKHGGAALIVDYGEGFAQDDSTRGFHKHTQVSILSQPGRVDVTADVDFAACARAAQSKGAVPLPLVTQVRDT